MSLGVLDWGIGGVFAALRALEREPTLDLVYRSDSANTPYGKQTRAELARSVGAALDWLAEAGAEQILIACHSGSTALRDLSPPVPTWGVIEPHAVPPDAGKLLVLGGARTIRSGHWHRALASLPGERRIVQRVSQPLSAHIEAGRTDHPDCLADLDRILAPALDADVVVLACTHYTALGGAIAARMPQARQVDPAMFVVDGLSLRPGSGQVRWTSSGDAQVVRDAARRWAR